MMRADVIINFNYSNLFLSNKDDVSSILDLAKAITVNVCELHVQAHYTEGSDKERLQTSCK